MAKQASKGYVVDLVVAIVTLLAVVGVIVLRAYTNGWGVFTSGVLGVVFYECAKNLISVIKK